MTQHKIVIQNRETIVGSKHFYFKQKLAQMLRVMVLGIAQFYSVVIWRDFLA